MSTRNKTSSKKTTKPANKKSLFRRLDIQLPWLKFAAVIIVGGLIFLNLLGVIVLKSGDPYDKIKIAPMSKHVRATERFFEGRKLVALTFDDGPSAATTPRLLDILYEKDAPSTFFMLGNMASRNPDIVRRAEKEGHVVASHTMSHQNLIRVSAATVKADIDEAKTVFNNILGHLPTLTRPPYGNINDNVRSYVGTPMILWSVDTRDWENRDPAQILANALNQSYDGAIILMHDIYPTTIDAVPRIIDSMRSAGYEFVTIPELVEMRGATLLNGTAYYNFRP